MTSGVTRDEIRAAYVCLLGREPESETAYSVHCSHKDVFQLRRALLESEEYLERMAAIRHAQQKDALFFIHMEKTGGTTLHHELARNFDPGEVSPPHYGFLSDYMMSEARYAFFSGHFNYDAVLNTPRRTRRVVSIFRDPVERLKSEYRFSRSHPVPDNQDEARGSHPCEAASA